MKVLIIFAAFVASVWGKVLPDYFLICKKSDPHIEKCIINGIEGMRSYLMSGIPEIKLPSLDPYHLATLKLDKDLQNVHVKAVIKNAIGYGAKDFQIKNLKVNVNDEDNYEGKLTLLLPRLEVTADYEDTSMNLTFPLFKDKGCSGRFEGNFTDVMAVVNGRAKAVLKNGVKHLQIEELNTDVTLGNGHVLVHDSKGDAIGDLATSFFNSYPNVILNELMPIISDVATITVKNVVAKIVKALPLDEVLEP